MTIIDGQHRIRGIEVAIDRLKNYIETNYQGKKIIGMINWIICLI